MLAEEVKDRGLRVLYLPSSSKIKETNYKLYVILQKRGKTRPRYKHKRNRSNLPFALPTYPPHHLLNGPCAEIPPE